MAAAGVPVSLEAQLRGLPERLDARLRAVAELAAARGLDAYLVGGTVRDLLLGAPAVDLDVVVTGDAPALAVELAERLGARPRVHPSFGTATLVWPSGAYLDIVTARREQYARPGALPVVTAGSLGDDLRRRDFSINAMALSLSPDRYGELLDPLGGQADLCKGFVRALHAASFRDDPTRLLRAIRYEQRHLLDEVAAGGAADGDRPFALEPETTRWFGLAVASRALATLTTGRVLHEFARLLAEPRAAAMLDRLADLGVLRQVDPALHWDRRLAGAIAELTGGWQATAGPLWFGRVALLLAQLDAEEASAAAHRLHLPTGATRLVEEAAAARAVLTQARALPDVVLARRLDRFTEASLRVLLAASQEPHERGRLAHYLNVVRRLRPTLGGDFIRDLGVPPGPIYRKALAALRDQKRAVPALTPEGEAAYLREWLVGAGALPPDA